MYETKTKLIGPAPKKLKQILIIATNQFGYLTDTYKYCEYLKDAYSVTYICWDYRLPKIDSKGVNVKYIVRPANKITRFLKLLKSLRNDIRTSNYDFVFIKYFLGVSLIKALNRKINYNIDIRTNSIRRSKFSRHLYDSLMTYECSFFSNVSIVSKSLAQSLRLKKWHVLPLGGERFVLNEKSFDNIHLLYVGTLHMRNILDSVKGFHKYLIERSSFERINLHFTIIGNASGNELQEIKDYIVKNKLEQFIETLGYVHHNELYKYFEKANVGVSYIPMTEYFDNQPPTKTYEYLLSGLPVIATSTKENINILNENYGVLINDNSDSFAKGLQAIIAKRNGFKSEDIRKSCEENLWENIVNDNLKNYIDILTNKNSFSRKDRS